MANEFLTMFYGMSLSAEEFETAQQIESAASGSTWNQFVNRARIANANTITAVLQQHGYNPSRMDVLRAAFADPPVGDPMFDQLAQTTNRAGLQANV